MTVQDDFHRYLAPTSRHPLLLEIDYGEGIYLVDISGKRYMDLIAGIGVSSVGHANPRIAESVSNQIRKHAHVMVYGEYIQKPVLDLAKKLASLLPDNLSTSYFVNSGTEANEAAIKLAKRVTNRPNIISFHHSYHGNTQGSLSVSANEAKKQPFRPLLPGITFIDFNSIDQLSAINHETAAVIIEPIQGDAGVIVPSIEFMCALREKCNDKGAQLIFDEVQTGIGRTGKMFAFEHFCVVPDIITLAKGLGGGFPIGAFLSSHQTMDKLSHEPALGHITTFGGNPVSCAAALATLEIIEQPELLDSVEEKGALFETLLDHRNIRDIRRKGLMMAVQLEDETKVNRMIELAIDDGLIIFWFLSARNSFRISPPLTITHSEIEEAATKLVSILDKI